MLPTPDWEVCATPSPYPYPDFDFDLGPGPPAHACCPWRVNECNRLLTGIDERSSPKRSEARTPFGCQYGEKSPQLHSRRKNQSSHFVLGLSFPCPARTSFLSTVRTSSLSMPTLMPSWLTSVEPCGTTTAPS